MTEPLKCPHCQNDDRRLIENVALHIEITTVKTHLCACCSREWETKETVNQPKSKLEPNK
jgi:hypothetical protein